MVFVSLVPNSMFKILIKPFHHLTLLLFSETIFLNRVVFQEMQQVLNKVFEVSGYARKYTNGESRICCSKRNKLKLL